MKRFLLALLTVFVVAAAAISYLVFFKIDTHAPAILLGRKDIIYRSGMNDSELLEGVIAIDDVNGDVTSSLSVLNVAPGEEEGTVDVTYRAFDRHNNVSTLVYTMKTGETPAGQENSEDGGALETAESSPREDAEGASGEAASRPEESEQAKQARAEQEAKIEELSPLSPRIHLSEYYTEVMHGTDFNPLAYVEEIQDDVDEREFLFTRIQVYGLDTLDMNVPGSYELTYYLMDSEGHQSNMAILTVRVL